MGAICNPLFQNKRHMVESGLFGDLQYDSGVIKLVDCMDSALEHLDGSNHIIVVSDHNKVKNEWEYDEKVVFQYPSSKKAEKDIEYFHQFPQRHCHPKIKAMKFIGTYDTNGHPKEFLTYGIERVINLGADLSLGKNHAHYVNAKGKYDIVEFLTDHCGDFKYLYNFAVGGFAPHIKTKVGLESLFSQSFHILHPNHSRTTADTFEMLVMENH